MTTRHNIALRLVVRGGGQGRGIQPMAVVLCAVKSSPKRCRKRRSLHLGMLAGHNWKLLAWNSMEENPSPQEIVDVSEIHSVGEVDVEGKGDTLLIRRIPREINLANLL